MKPNKKRRNTVTRKEDMSEKISSLPWRRLWDYTKGQRWRFIFVILGTLISTAAGVIFPLIIGQGIGGVIESKNFGELDMLALALVALFAIQAFGSYFQHYYVSYIGETITFKLRKALYEKLLQLDMPFHATHKSGELASRVSSDTTTVQTVFTQVLPSLFGSIISLIAVVVVMVNLNPQLTLFIFGIVPIIIVVAVILGRLIQKMGTKNQDLLAANTGISTEVIKNISVVKAFTSEDYEAKRYDESLDDVFRSVVHTSRLSSINMAIIMFLGFDAIAAIIWFAGRQAIEGTLTIGLITTFLIYGIQIAMTFAQLSQLYTQMKLAVGSSRRVFDIIDQPLALKEPEHPVKLKNTDTFTIDIKDVVFRYGDAPALNDLNLTVTTGKVAALVGPSGAGKTTTFELLQRFYDPLSGIITVNGVDVRDMGSHELRSHIATVSQNAPLFSGTVRDNIAYGNQEADEAAIIAAAKAAQADEFIVKLPEGYDTILGEGGIGLSGGQRQRLAIARAVIKNAPILLLDEATSALDTKSERLVQKALDELMKNRTTLVIAHRLSTIENADTIFVMADGAIVEEGTHAKLLSQNGLYSELYSQQKKEKGELA
jgi:ATP-binding cassette, subfamily B, bacterial MsbA